MLSFSPGSYAALTEASEQAFVSRLAGVLREAVPSLAKEPDAPFHEQVRILVRHARSFGLTSEQTVGAYAVTAALLGLNFADRFAGARQILLGHETQARKAELLEGFTMALLETLEGGR